MHVSEYGDPAGPVLLLLHGGMLTGSMWEQQVEEFAGRRHVLVPDLPGHGRSSDVPASSYADVADALAGTLAARLGARQDAAAVGYSLGGQILLTLIARHPGLLRESVLVSTLTQEVLEPAVEGPTATAVPRQRSADAFAAEKRAFRLPAGLFAARTRMLSVCGEHDAVEVLDSAAATAAAFQGGKSLTVAGTGLDWIVYRPEESNRTLEAWLAGDRPSQTVPSP